LGFLGIEGLEMTARYWGKLLKRHDGVYARLAAELGVSRQLMYEWLKRGFIPTSRAFDVEHATKGVVTAMEIAAEAKRLKNLELRSGKC
jgi:DNA-binding transcriptional regulator YdaS (Cro superfamily)